MYELRVILFIINIQQANLKSVFIKDTLTVSTFTVQCACPLNHSWVDIGASLSK